MITFASNDNSLGLSATHAYKVRARFSLLDEPSEEIMLEVVEFSEFMLELTAAAELEFIGVDVDIVSLLRPTFGLLLTLLDDCDTRVLLASFELFKSA